MQTDLYSIAIEKLQAENQEKDRLIDYWKEQAQHYQRIAQDALKHYQDLLDACNHLRTTLTRKP